MATMLDAPRHTDSGHRSSHRVMGAALAGVGALLFVVGGLVHFYVAPTLSIAPIDQSSVTHLEAKGATLFDSNPEVLAPITTDLSITSKTTGDVTASEKAGGDTRVWTGANTITSDVDGVIRSQSVKRVAFNGKTAEAVNCCDNWNEAQEGVREPVTRTGLQFKFPFNTEKKSYQVWDDTAAKAVTTRYTGTTKIRGMEVYVFKNEIPAMQTDEMEVPQSIFGLEGTDAVTAADMYQNSTTYYVEPTTGGIVNQVSDTKSWLSYDGNDLITTEAHISFTDAQVKDMVDNVLGNQPALLRTAQGFLPWLIVVGGLVMIVVGGAIGRRQHA